MKPRTYLFIILLSWFLPACPSIAQQIFFNKVLPPEGKKFNRVEGIVQDAQGYMWLATFKGLFRYDGYQMVQYKHDPEDSNSLADDWVGAICIDSSGIIWLSTSVNTSDKGLERFDPGTGIFTHFHHDPNNPATIGHNSINALLVDHEGTLWLGTDNGLDRYDSKKNEFIHYRHKTDDSTSLSCNHVLSLYEDRQGTLWVGTGNLWILKKEEEEDGGLNMFNKWTGKFTCYLHDPGNPHSLINNKVRSIFEDSRGTFWIGTSGDGLHTMNRATGRFQRYPYDPNHSEKLSRPHQVGGNDAWMDFFAFITEDATGAIWIGTHLAGINYYDPVTKKVTHFENEKDIAGNFSQNSTSCAYRSREGILWIGTAFGDLYLVNPFVNKTLEFCPSSSPVWSVFEEPDGTLWTGIDNGLVCQNQINKSSVKFISDPQDPTSLSNNSVNTIIKDRNDNIWVGTRQGLNLSNKEKKGFIRFYHDPKKGNSLSIDDILILYEDSHSDLWVGSAKGLNRMNKDFSFQRYLFHPDDTLFYYSNWVGPIVESKRGTIWVNCTLILDVHQLNPKTGTFKTYLTGKGIRGICEDVNGIFWAGGDDGLFWYNNSIDAFVSYTDSSTQTTFNNIRSIVRDGENLWIKTDKAILKFSAQHKVTRVYKAIGKNMRAVDTDPLFKGENGKFFFFGESNSGYYVFRPDTLSQANPPQIVSVFSLIDMATPSGMDDLSLQQSTQAKNVDLKYNQNSFAFEFAVIDYTSPEDNRHFFMLENYDRTWRNAGIEHKAIYYNVPPGHYVFRIKGSNSNGIWAEKSINIVITPPWWSTWWFRITAVVVMIAVLYGLIRWRVKEKFRLQLEQSEKEKQLAMLNQKTSELETKTLRAEMDQVLKLQQMRTRIASDLHDDIGSTLTSISYYSELVKMQLKEDDASLKPMLDKIGGNARNTVNAMSDIVWIINPKNDTTENMVNRMKHYAAEMLNERNIQYAFNSNQEIEKLELNMQQRKNIYLIYKEAVHNSVKYSECRNIEIDFTVTDQQINLSIHDNGKGFDTQQSGDGNGLINMKKRADEINANFEICTTQGHGTRIKLTCKIT